MFPIIAILIITGLLYSLSIITPVNLTLNQGSFEISPIFTLEVQYWSTQIIRWANTSSLDPDLVAVIMQIESCGDPFAISTAGAIGLFQVMPFHFIASEDPFNPATNALRGLTYLSRSFEAANGNIRLTLAGYNGGIGLINQSEHSWPAETLRYVYFGVPIYKDANNGLFSSDRLQEWYVTYGIGLCHRASQRLGIE